MTNAVVASLTNYYGSADAVENAGVAYRLGDEWVILEAGRNIAANLRRVARVEAVFADATDTAF